MQSLALAQEWISECLSSHENCGKRASKMNYSPTRLLDIGEPGSTYCRLHISDTNKHSLIIYIALSYQWGDSQPLKLTTTTVSELCRGLPISQLSKTFRDAVSVCHYLSVRYLWVDALCIMQDSKEDWQRESMRMRDIYSYSYCTIAAAVSRNPTDDLFRSREIEDIRSGTVQTDWGAIDPSLGLLKIFERWGWSDEIARSPLY
jgi:Heterokaryon incompatibility protein (HET)